MIPLVLVTGFLGSGKTTLLQQLARRHRGRRIAWVVNEFSARDMDTSRVAAEAKDVVGIAGGSVFCRCKAGEFLDLLRGVPDRFSPEAVVIEASGMADPVVAGKMLAESGLDRTYLISAVVAVVDPGSFLKLLHTLPNIRSQVEAATVVLLNKTDLHAPDHLAQTEEAVRRINPSVPVIRTSHCGAEVAFFGVHSRPEIRGELAPCVDPNFEKLELTPAGETDFELLRRAVESLREEIYRLKGVARSSGRQYRLDYSASGWHIEEGPGGEPEGIAIIARGPGSERVRTMMRQVFT